MRGDLNEMEELMLQAMEEAAVQDPVDSSDTPPGGGFDQSLPTSLNTELPAPPANPKQKEDEVEPVPEEAIRDAILDAFKPLGVQSVLIRQDEGVTYYDALFPEDVSFTVTFAKVAPDEEKEPMWSMLVLTPSEVLS